MRRTPASSFTAALALPLALILSACHTPDPVDHSPDGPAGDGKEDTLFPVGEENLGYLTIQPADGSALGLSPIPAHVGVDTRNVAYGEKTRLPAGWHTVGWSLATGEGLGMMQASVVAKTDTTVVGAGLHVNGSLDLPVTFGPKVRVVTPWVVGGSVLQRASEPGHFVPVGPGEFSFALALEAIDELPFWSDTITLASGEVKSLDLSPPDPRGQIVIKPPVRAFPSARLESWFATSRFYSVETLAGYPTQGKVYREKYLLNQASWAINVDALTAELEHTVLGNTAWKKRYFLWLNGTYATYEVEPGKTTTVQMQRLDVDDVDVTREDGSKFRTAGTYSIEWLNPAGTYVAWPDLQKLPTKTGVDLVPGHYRVTVAYTTAEPPGPKQDVYELDLK